MPIERLTPRKAALLARRRRKVEWKHNPANPDMVVCTRLLFERGFGLYELRPVELSAEEMSEVARESFDYAAGSPDKPEWDRDPLYFAAKKLRKRRRARSRKSTGL